jgi:homoserine kinase
VTFQTKGAIIMSLERLKAAQHRARVDVSVPGSSANLGPGFDTFGLAIALNTNFTFLVLEKPDEKIPFVCYTESTDCDWQSAESFIERIMARYFRSYAETRDRLRIIIDSDLPVGRGLGSSASTILGALWASYRLDGRVPTFSRLLAQAAELEGGHPDNVGACLYGGFVVTGRSKKSPGVFAVQMKWPEQWCPLFVVPQTPVSTAKARAILPKSVSRADAVWNLQHATLLVSAITKRDEELMREALDDRLHEPFRYGLVPELPILKKMLKATPAIGCVLSGAGSSTMVLVNKRHRSELKDQLQNWANSFSTPPKILDLKVDHKGLQEINE